MDGVTAVLILDAQVNMFDQAMPVYQAAELLPRLRSLIRKARQSRAPVIYVQNEGGPGDPDEPGTLGWRIHPALEPDDGDPIVRKRVPDAFQATKLDQILKTRGVQRLVVAGMQTELCINTTVRRARELGYAVTLVADAHSTFDGRSETAAQRIERHNRELASVAEVMPAAAITFPPGGQS